MATTIESLRKLGLKVNGSEPTNNNIGNIINEIADDYQGGSGSAGVSSIGGVDGAITLGTGLSMSGQELQVSASGGGGTQLYKHTIPIEVDFEGETSEIMFEFITTRSTPFVFTPDTLSTVNDELNKCLAEAVHTRVYMVNPEPGYAYYAMSSQCIGPTQTGTATPGQSGHGDIQFQNMAFVDSDSITTIDSIYMDCLTITDTVVAL